MAQAVRKCLKRKKKVLSVSISNEATKLSQPVRVLLHQHALFCNTMMTDGVKLAEKEENVKVLDIAELVAASM